MPITLTPHPELHPVFETLGYALGFAVYRRARQTEGDFLNDFQRWSVIAAAALGAMVGSRLLGLIEESPGSSISLARFFTPSGGKTIVGGLLGGWLCVELAKALQGIRSRTGDLFAIPLCIGIAVGRIGCLLAGLADHTYGAATTLPWGVDFGDGVARHPTQIYEILFLAALAFALRKIDRRPHQQGLFFRIFMASYLLWRLLIDLLKPDPLVYGMNAIQWACLAGVVALALSARRAKFEKVK